VAEFPWEPNIERGEWLRPMEEEPFTSLLSTVPRGFEMYARIFHPIERDRPRHTKTWLGVDEATFSDNTEDANDADDADDLETEPASWTQAAASFGTTMHAEAQYARLVRSDYGETHGVIAPDGWRYGDTREGSLDPATFAFASGVLARHTSTPGTGIAAVWEGWGLFDVARASRYSVDTETSRDGVLPKLAGRVPKKSVRSRSEDMETGPRFELLAETGRSYVLFQAGAQDFADPSWPRHAPWVREDFWYQSPNLLWPEDHAWVLASEIDFDSTLIAGTTALISELVRTPGLEVLPIRADADLTWDGDAINRPETSYEP